MAQMDPNNLRGCPDVDDLLVVSARRRYRVLQVRRVLHLNGELAKGKPAWWVVACRQRKDGVLIGRNHALVYVEDSTQLVG